MRIPALFLSLLVVISVTSGLQAQMQNPGARQDAEAAREKLLSAADQLDNIQANSEATKTSVDGMKAQVTQLQGDLAKVQAENAALKQQVTEMQAAFEQYKADQVKSRQALIDNVAGMIADKSGGTKTTHKKETPDASPEKPAPVKFAASTTTAPSLRPPPDPPASTASAPSTTTTSAETTPPAKPQKGYYHTVEPGETLKMICAAYRENGVNVTMAQVRKANGLTEKSVLKAGQKLFIPKPAN